MSTKPLYDFLLDRFTTPDLARFVYFRYGRISIHLSSNDPLSQYAQEFIKQRTQHGLLNDGFCASLTEERPNSAGVIESLRQHFAQPVASHSPAQPLVSPKFQGSLDRMVRLSGDKRGADAAPRATSGPTAWDAGGGSAGLARSRPEPS